MRDVAGDASWGLRYGARHRAAALQLETGVRPRLRGQAEKQLDRLHKPPVPCGRCCLPAQRFYMLAAPAIRPIRVNQSIGRYSRRKPAHGPKLQRSPHLHIQDHATDDECWHGGGGGPSLHGVQHASVITMLSQPHTAQELWLLFSAWGQAVCCAPVSARLLHCFSTQLTLILVQRQ